MMVNGVVNAMVISVISLLQIMLELRMPSLYKHIQPYTTFDSYSASTPLGITSMHIVSFDTMRHQRTVGLTKSHDQSWSITSAMVWLGRKLHSCKA